MGKKFLAAAAGLAMAVSMSAQAQAAELVFHLTGNSKTTGADANRRLYTATDGINSAQVWVSAWSLDSSGVIRDSYLGAYSNGLGVTSGDEDGKNETHAFDNHTRKDFIILQFDQQVELLKGQFNTYSIFGKGKDSDATIGYGTVGTPFNTQLNLNDKNVSALNALLDGSYVSTWDNGNSNYRPINPSGFAGNLWIIGASFSDKDKKTIDGFKFSKLSVNTVPGVPEPSTWAMMIAGFGMVGYGMRRRRPQGNAAIA
jgi:hypothetical protein